MSVGVTKRSLSVDFVGSSWSSEKLAGDLSGGRGGDQAFSSLIISGVLQINGSLVLCRVEVGTSENNVGLQDRVNVVWTGA